MSERTPADAAVREKALSPDQSFIVQAPAGSGKTELLTRRVLTLLAIVNEPEEVLAITFTRKAAHEMRNRVIETLSRAASEPPPELAYELEGYDLAMRVLARDKEQGWGLIKNPQRLNLRTIDALNTTLAHRLPVVSGLGAALATTDNAMSLYLAAAERLLESKAEKLDLFLLHLGNQQQRVQHLLAELLASRDQWLRIVLHGLPEEDLREELERMLQQLVISRLERLNELMPASVMQQLSESLRHAVEALQGLHLDSEEPPPLLVSLANITTLPGTDVEDLPAWEGVANLLLVKSGPDPRKKLTKTVGFPTSPNDAKVLGISVPVLKARKQALTDQLEILAEHTEALSILDEVRSLPEGVYKDSDWNLLAQLLGILKELVYELIAVFAEKGQMDFVEMAMRAQTALGSEDAPTDLALSLDLKIKHILVDEFQDTSRTQFRLYELLVAGWQPDEQRTFFAVGDPMQSIYRFRDGDVTLFTLAQEQGIGSVRLEPLSLSVNFRASKDVVGWVNNTFADVLPAQTDDITGSVPYAASDAHKSNPGLVQLHKLLDESKQEEADRVAELAQAAIAETEDVAGALSGRVAILLRSRAQAAPIFAALQARAIPYQSIDMEVLGNRQVVVDIEALVLALRYPHDRLHWLSLLRAPWCGLTLKDLHVLMDNSAKDPLITLLQDPVRTEALSAEGQQRVARFLDVIQPAYERASRDALVPWVEACWMQLGGPVCCKSSIDVDAAQRCFARLHQLEQSGELWQASVLRNAMESLYAGSGDDDQAPVQVMTLHKSKGLEFDTVILPALDRQPRNDQQKAINWFYAGRDNNEFLLLAPIGERGVSGDKADRIYKLVRKARQRCEEQEMSRLLYVACTRAKRQLHLLATYKTTAKDEIAKVRASSLLAPLEPLFESVAFSKVRVPVKDPAVQIADATATADPPQLQQMPVDWKLPTLEQYQWPEPVKQAKTVESEVEFSWAGTLARDIGNVVHEQLQLLANASLEERTALLGSQRERAEQALKNTGVSQERMAEAVDQVLKGLNNTLQDERGQWILSSKHREARSEWALSALVAGTVKRIVIDRTFVDSDGVRWIVDFKTGDHSGKDVDAFLDSERTRYAPQLSGYADIMKHIDDRPIRLALYFPMLKGFREFDPGDYL